MSLDVARYAQDRQRLFRTTCARFASGDDQGPDGPKVVQIDEGAPTYGMFAGIEWAWFTSRECQNPLTGGAPTTAGRVMKIAIVRGIESLLNGTHVFSTAEEISQQLASEAAAHAFHRNADASRKEQFGIRMPDAPVPPKA